MLYLILFLLIIAVITAAVWFLVHSVTKYHQSEKYILKERNRLTNQSDVKILAKEYNFSPEYEKALWELCKIRKVPNIRFLVKDIQATTELLKSHYYFLKDQKASAEEINEFFNLQYKIEQITAKTKRLRHTKQIPDGSIIFYITPQGEQLPFNLIKKDKNALYLEIPAFLTARKQEPALLDRNRYNYKTSDGLSYTFFSRTIRYEDSTDSKRYMLISQSEKLLTEVQRHYKREFINMSCKFSAIQIRPAANKDEEDSYVFSDKEYTGILTNISGGGCCIKTDLPIKEKQHLNVNLKELGIKDTIIGLIRRTRKLPDGFFALHIQFIELTVETQNKILAYVYKYEL